MSKKLSIEGEYLWKLMKAKATEDELDEYVAAVRKICKFGINRAKLIRDTFPLYTLHDEEHIRNVLRLMRDLLGSRVDELRLDEAATLVICACCHDMGMSYSEKEKRELLVNYDKINTWLEEHPKEQVQACENDTYRPVLDDVLQRSFFRSIHHERVLDLLHTKTWPDALVGKVDRDVIVRVCQSHGNDVSTLDKLDPTTTIDLRMCAVLLRLADILDFDDSRAPKAIYEYCDFDACSDAESRYSAMEWRKHLSGTLGFTFPPVADRERSYDLEYHASCDDPQVEQGVRGYLDWVDKELLGCSRELTKYVGKWQNLMLPQKVKRSIISNGYESGSFRLTLDQDKVLDLLVGNDLYEDQSVFVRELIQNAIDAVRTRQQLDTRRSWTPHISIRTWTDNEGYNWFRIEDNGVGMTKQIMLNHLLKVGSSYYSSDDFQREKLLQGADPDYRPISRFGIGILSCFMDGSGAALVEISTRHYERNAESLRLRIDDKNGFYRLCKRESGHHPGPMYGETPDEQREYLLSPGTAIAVRTNLYASGTYSGFKDIVDKYVAFPPVAIHYEGPEGTFDYPTEEEFVARACGIDTVAARHGDSLPAHVVDLPVPAGVVEQIQSVWPEFSWPQDFKVQLGRLPLGAYAETPHVSGAAVVARTVGEIPTFVQRVGTHEIEMRARVDLEPVALNAELDHTIRLRVLVQPSDEKLNELLSQYKKFAYSDDMDVLTRQHTEGGDSCLNDILSALHDNSTLKSEQRTSMKERFNLGEEELDQEIERARDIIGQHTGLSPDELDLALALSRKCEWRFAVCDLTSLDWFTSSFGSAYARLGHKFVVAHNGIACGSAEGLFCDKRSNSHCVAAVLLLKDKYRPELGLARDGIRSYTLETQLVLELMRRRIQADGFYLGEDQPARSTDHHLRAATKYEEVLAYNKELTRDLTLVIDDNEQVRIDELVRARQDHALHVSYAPILMWDSDSGMLAQRHQQFCWAYAQQKFTIKASFNDSTYGAWRGEAQLCPKEKNDLPQGYHKFPPHFFALPLSPEDTHLATSTAAWRRWINAKHPLSDFLLQNADALQKHTPGILMEFTRCLTEDDGEELVSKANTLLDRLRALHKSPLEVRSNLQLKDSDLY